MGITVIERTREEPWPELTIHIVRVQQTVRGEEYDADWYRLYDDERNIHPRGMVGDHLVFWREERPTVDVEGFEAEIHEYDPLQEGADAEELREMVTSMYQAHHDGRELPIPDYSNGLSVWVHGRVESSLAS